MVTYRLVYLFRQNKSIKKVEFFVDKTKSNFCEKCWQMAYFVDTTNSTFYEKCRPQILEFFVDIYKSNFYEKC